MDICLEFRIWCDAVSAEDFEVFQPSNPMPAGCTPVCTMSDELRLYYTVLHKIERERDETQHAIDKEKEKGENPSDQESRSAWRKMALLDALLALAHLVLYQTLRYDMISYIFDEDELDNIVYCEGWQIAQIFPSSAYRDGEDDEDESEDEDQPNNVPLGGFPDPESQTRH